MPTRVALQVVDLKRVQYNRIEVKGMATETITIQVDPEAARVYKAAPPGDQRKMGALLGLWLTDVATAEPAALKRRWQPKSTQKDVRKAQVVPVLYSQNCSTLFTSALTAASASTLQRTAPVRNRLLASGTSAL